MRVCLKHISKNYSACAGEKIKPALNDVCAEFYSGEIHAVLGENGAGKSTLMGILSGFTQPTSGKIIVDKSEVVFANPRAARRRGVAIVNQNPLLAATVSTRENAAAAFSGDFILSGKRIQKRLTEISQAYGISIDIDKRTGELSSVERLYAAILCALAGKPRFLILDEPAASGASEERQKLYAVINKIAASGVGIILITHYIAEALSVAARVTVLKGGRVAGAFCRGADESAVKRLMFDNRETCAPVRSSIALESAPEIFSVVNLTVISHGARIIDSISFKIKRREVCLITGLPEDGLTALEEAVCGLISDYSGEILLRGRTLKKGNPKSVFRNGAGIVFSDKESRASSPAISVYEMLSVRSQIKTGSFFNYGAERVYVKAAIAKEKFTDVGLDQKTTVLSGGMLQRLILDRELDARPEFLILGEPTQGLDDGGAREILLRIRRSADAGAGALILCGDRGVIAPYADSLYEMKRGKLYSALSLTPNSALNSV